MKDFLMKFEPVDCIAIIAIVISFILLYFGVDHVVPAVITMIAGYYFGHKRKQENHAEKESEGLPIIDESK
jgi:uncharacterized membrane protein